MEEHWQSECGKGSKTNQTSVKTVTNIVKGPAPATASPRRLSFSGDAAICKHCLHLFSLMSNRTKLNNQTITIEENSPMRDDRMKAI